MFSWRGDVAFPAETKQVGAQSLWGAPGTRREAPPSSAVCALSFADPAVWDDWTGKKACFPPQPGKPAPRKPRSEAERGAAAGTPPPGAAPHQGPPAVLRSWTQPLIQTLGLARCQDFPGVGKVVKETDPPS